jgi:hypothetical protein
MPREKDLKRLVRARMQKTGEAYTAARAQVLRKRTTKPPRTASTTQRLTPSPRTPSPDFATLGGMKDAVMKEKTGRTWEAWVETLDRHGATGMRHGEIAALVNEAYNVDGWWSQMVTVGYERIKGLRARGQRLDGSYEASKSRTFNVPVATLFDAWADATVRRRWMDGASVRVRTATSPKSMRLGWTDGTIIAVWFTSKGAGRSVVALAHSKLPDKATADRLKRYWSERLDALARELA